MCRELAADIIIKNTAAAIMAAIITEATTIMASRQRKGEFSGGSKSCLVLNKINPDRRKEGNER